MLTERSAILKAVAAAFGIPESDERAIACTDAIVDNPPLTDKQYREVNAQVDAIIEQARHQKYANRERIPEPYLAYADAYNELTGQEPTKRVLMDWLGTFSDWQGEGIQVHHIRAAFEQAKNRFPVIRPGSLTNLAAAIRAQGKTKAAATEYHDPMDHLQRAMALHAND